MRSRPQVALVCVASRRSTWSCSTKSTAGSCSTAASAWLSSLAVNPFSTRPKLSRWIRPPRVRAFSFARSPDALSLSTTMYCPSIFSCAFALDGTTTSAAPSSASATFLTVGLPVTPAYMFGTSTVPLPQRSVSGHRVNAQPRVRDRTYDLSVPTLTLLHNPHCPTSVHALEALEEAGHEVTIRKYLLVAERLDEAELRSLAERLQGDPVDALIRRDKKYKDLGLEADGWDIDQVVATLLEHPSLLQRPILDDGTATMIGRPRSRPAEWAKAGRVV